MALTRAQLRTRIARRLEDLTSLTATMDGSTTQFIDVDRLGTNTEVPRNREIVFLTGHASNVGLSRLVTNWDLQAGWVSFDALPQAIAEGDTAEMYNFRGTGFRKDEYDAAIAQAMSEAYPLYKQYYDDVVTVYDEDTFELTPPTGIEWVSGLSYLTSVGTLVDIPYSTRPYNSGWSIGPDGGVVVYDRRYSTPIFSAVASGTVRMRGYGPPTALTTDSSTTDIHPEWLVNKAAMILCLSGMSRDRNNNYRAQVFAQEADRNMTAIRTRGTMRKVRA